MDKKTSEGSPVVGKIQWWKVGILLGIASIILWVILEILGLPNDWLMIG